MGQANIAHDSDEPFISMWSDCEAMDVFLR
jgi:hypothetical protein